MKDEKIKVKYENKSNKVFGMNRKLIYPLLGLAVLSVIALFIVATGNKDKEKTPEEVISTIESKPTIKELTPDMPAPPFKLADLNTLAIVAVPVPGKPTLIDFVATWCPHCQKMAPVIAKSLPDDVKLVTVGAARESDTKVKDFHNNFLKKPMPGAVVNDKDLAITKQYGVPGYPTMVFVDANGEVKSIKNGEVDKAELNSAFKSIR